MLTYISTPKTILPAYSTNSHQFTVYDVSIAADSNLYYSMFVYITGQSDPVIIEQPKNENNQAVFNIGGILQGYFNSTIYNHTALSLDTSILSYYVSVKGFGSNSSYYTYRDSSIHYVFNGVENYTTFDVSSYCFTPSKVSNFLTTWSSERDIHYADNTYLQFLSGKFRNIDSSFNGLTVTRYQINGDSSLRNIILTKDTSAKIVSLNVCPSTLNNSIGSTFIDSSTTYYTIKEKSGLSNTYKFNILPVDTRFPRYYRIFYVGSLGATEAFNFDLTAENVINIDKQYYTNNSIKKVFGTTIEDTYTISCNWISEEMSINLKELWGTPEAQLVEGFTLVPIIITEKSKQILNVPVRLINYTLSYIRSDDYKIQKN